MNISAKRVIRFISLGDQVSFSAANFLLTILLARYYSEIEFAGYGIGLSISLTLLGVQRHCYLLQNSIRLPGLIRNRTPKVLGQQAIICIILGVIEVAVFIALLLSNASPLYLAVAASTIVCSSIYVQLDFDRMLLIKHEKYWYSLITSTVFLLLIGFLFVAIPHFGLSFFLVLYILAGYSCLKFICLLFVLGRPDFFGGWRLVKRDFRKYFFGALSGVIGYSGHNHVPLFVLGFVAAPVQAAAFVAMRGLMQPLQIIIRSLDVIDKNFFQTNSGGNVRGMREVFFRQVSAYGALALMMVLAMVLVGENISHLAYGEKYSAYSDILLGWALIFSMLVISLPIETVIIKLNKLNIYNHYRISAGMVGAIVAFFLCGSYGAVGAVIACFSGWLVSVMCALWLIREVIFPKKNDPALARVNL